MSATPKTLARIPLPVRWRDLDAFNHLNNANYLGFLEEARLVWLQGLPGPWMDGDSAPVLAAIQVNYRRPVGWPATLLVELACTRLGNSSLTLAHRMLDAGDPGTVHADGEVVLVWVDRTSGQPVPLPEAVRAACAQ